jgi:hypothetical protein
MHEQIQLSVLEPYLLQSSAQVQLEQARAHRQRCARRATHTCDICASLSSPGCRWLAHPTTEGLEKIMNTMGVSGRP